MVSCKSCKGNKVHSRVNYTHGKKSNARTILTCKSCGCTEMEANRRRR